MEQFILAISECQKELTQALVDGVPNWDTYLKIVGEINGLEQSKNIIYKLEEAVEHDGSTEEDE